ncbi:hypothetical protein BS50DRAFT_605629 [Corynespora cassiicola Philippines]|uniref:INO80 complex subunit F domain-containing protein n=1 Tax=Corynespora cassiicola Philippines TaxID=1448308 RepID=A0A2T2P973_CORCC|nr:hypothetical protein BS50DRAFT_605629 [Corynespora cassiicola Philippines]
MAVATRALASKDLPPSVETAYYRKCIELRRRINDIEENNDGTRLRIKRLSRGIQKMRLERAFLLEQLQKHMEYNADDSDRSSSPPPTPTDKPLRSKRSHRKGTPPPGGAQLGSSVAGGTQQASPGSVTHIQILPPVNPMSSAQSTPDPNRSNNPFFSTIGSGSAVTSPQAVNGTGSGSGSAPSALPPLSSLPPLQPQSRPAAAESGRAYFDPAYDEQRPSATPADGEETPAAARSRAYSGSQAPTSAPSGAAAATTTTTTTAATGSAPPAPTSDAAATPQNGDTEMGDAAGGFTAVNRQ